MVLAHNAIEKSDQERANIWLLATASLGTVFLAGQIYEFTEFYHKLINIIYDFVLVCTLFYDDP